MKTRVYDRFLHPGDFAFLDDHCRENDYTGETNPRDGVTYPDISTDIPSFFLEEIVEELEEHAQRDLKVNAAFFRLTCEATDTAPHQAHNDTVMGKYTAILYMQDGPGGTDFVRHRATRVSMDPWTQGEADACMRDTNDYDAWDILESVEMQANRLVFFESKRMHRAEPVNGFGKDATDGRIVLTLFLDPA